MSEQSGAQLPQVSRRRLLRIASGAAVIGSLGGKAVTPAAADLGTQQWAFETGNDVWSSPTVVDGTVFVGSSDNNLYAVDTETGTQQWVFETSDSVSSPTVVDGAVFVGSGDDLYAVDAETGEQEWAFETGDSVSSPTVVDGTVFIGSMDNNLYAVDAETGTQQWAFETGSWVGSSPTVVDGTIFGISEGNLFAVDAETGEYEWTFQTDIWISTSSPTVADGTVFFGSFDDNLYAVDAETGDEEWAFETGDAVRSPTVMDETVFVGSGDNLYAVDARTGDGEWAFQTGNTVHSSPTVVDGTVFVGGDDTNLYAVDAETGNEEWGFETNDTVQSSPTVVDGTVFVGSSDNNLYAVEAGVSGSSEGSRAMLGTLGHHNEWRHNEQAIEIVSDTDTEQIEADSDGDTEEENEDGSGISFVPFISNPRLETISAGIGVSGLVGAGYAGWRYLSADDTNADETTLNSDYIDEKYDQTKQKLNQQGLEEITVPEPNTFDDYSKAEYEYDKIEESIDKWMKISECYKDIINKSHIPSPNEFEHPKQACKKYKELDELGSNIKQSLDISKNCREEYPDLPFDSLVNSITQSIESQGLPKKDQVKNWNQIAIESRDILTFLSEVDTNHLSVNGDKWVDQIELALSEEYPNVLHPIHNKVKMMDGSLWEHSDFDSYTWQEFESLVGDLYKSLGYETQVTSDTADLGVDVWASKDGEQTAIQAKKYQQGNSVGRETLQKLASTLAKGDADHVIVITTSSFARTAEDYASEFGPDMQIIDGDKLIEMLNNSTLAPPV